MAQKDVPGSLCSPFCSPDIKTFLPQPWLWRPMQSPHPGGKTSLKTARILPSLQAAFPYQRIPSSPSRISTLRTRACLYLPTTSVSYRYFLSLFRFPSGGYTQPTHSSSSTPTKLPFPKETIRIPSRLKELFQQTLLQGHSLCSLGRHGTWAHPCTPTEMLSLFPWALPLPGQWNIYLVMATLHLGPNGSRREGKGKAGKTEKTGSKEEGRREEGK